MNEINQLESTRLIYPFVAQAPVGKVPAAQGAATAAAPSAAGGVVTALPGDDTDSVEFSTTGTQLAQLEDAETLRIGKVARIRSEIQNGLYDINGKLEAVIGRVLDDVLA